MHVYEMSEWQGSGGWYCNDTKDLGGISGKWWIPAKLLNKTPLEYVQWLVETYKPDTIRFIQNDNCQDGLLLYSWKPENYGKMHQYVLFINKEARHKNFLV